MAATPAPVTPITPRFTNPMSLADILNLYGQQPFPKTFAGDTQAKRTLTIPEIGAPGSRIGVDATGKGGVSPADLGGTVPSVTLTLAQWENRYVTAASYAYAASAGRTNARTYVINGPDGKPTLSPAGPAGVKGTNRGLYGLNDKQFPAIPDYSADNPAAATIMVYILTRGFSDWTAFQTGAGAVGLDPTSGPAMAVRAQFNDMMGHVTDDSLSWVPTGVMDWAKALGALLSNLLNGAWWRRVGVGAAGVLMILLGLILSGLPTVEKLIP